MLITNFLAAVPEMVRQSFALQRREKKEVCELHMRYSETFKGTRTGC